MFKNYDLLRTQSPGCNPSNVLDREHNHENLQYHSGMLWLHAATLLNVCIVYPGIQKWELDAFILQGSQLSWVVSLRLITYSHPQVTRSRIPREEAGTEYINDSLVPSTAAKSLWHQYQHRSAHTVITSLHPQVCGPRFAYWDTFSGFPCARSTSYSSCTLCLFPLALYQGRSQNSSDNTGKSIPVHDERLIDCIISALLFSTHMQYRHTQSCWLPEACQRHMMPYSYNRQLGIFHMTWIWQHT